MVDIAEKNVLLEGSFIHAAELKGVSIRMSLVELLRTRELEEYTTECVKLELLNRSKKRNLVGEYVNTSKTAAAIGNTECSHINGSRPVSGVACVMSVVQLDGSMQWERDKNLVGKIKWTVATCDSSLIDQLRKEILTFVGDVVTRV